VITVGHGMEIRRPVETVFSFVDDLCQLPQWQEAIQEVQVSPDPTHRRDQGDASRVVSRREGGAGLQRSRRWSPTAP
jgi:uncharacterized membrane protein